jgi:hypothetical protein
MSDATLVDLGQDVLDALTARWPPPNTTLDLPHLAQLPERRYVTVGAPNADCEQLVVAVERTFGTGGGNPAAERVIPLGEGAPWLQTAVFAIQILRCVAVPDKQGKPPAPDVMSAEAFTQLTDQEGMLECLIAAQAAGELTGCGGLALEGWRAVTGSGGLSGGVTRVRLNLF